MSKSEQSCFHPWTKQSQMSEQEWTSSLLFISMHGRSNGKWMSKSERRCFHSLVCVSKAIAKEWARVNKHAFIHKHAWTKHMPVNEQERIRTLSFIRMREHGLTRTWPPLNRISIKKEKKTREPGGQSARPPYRVPGVNMYNSKATWRNIYTHTNLCYCVRGVTT